MPFEWDYTVIHKIQTPRCVEENLKLVIETVNSGNQDTELIN